MGIQFGNLDENFINAKNHKQILSDFDGFVFLCSRDYSLLFINRALAQHIGHKEWHGEKCYQIFHGKNKPCSWCESVRAFEGQTVTWQMRSPRDNRDYSVTDMPLRNEKGEIIGKQSFVREVSAQRSYNETLFSDAGKAKAIVAALDEGIAAMDTDFRIFYQNSVHQEREGHHLGEKCFAAIQGRNEPCPECQLVLSFKDGRVHRREHVIPTENGRVHLEITASPLRNHAGKIVGGLEVVRDISERRHAKEALNRSEESLRLLLESAKEGICAIDMEGLCTICNPAAAQMLGYDSPDELIGKNMHALVHHSHPDGTLIPSKECQILEASRRGESCAVEDEVFWKKNGSWMPVSYHSHPILDGEKVTGAIVLFSDISQRIQTEHQLKEKENRLNFLAYNDHLTNLPNRVLFEDRLKHSLDQARRYGRNIALLFLDVDRFRHINDTFGHETGDQILCAVGARLKETIRDSDTVARYGGDEFLVILENLQHLGKTAVVARDIQEKLSRPIFFRGQEVSVTSSIGICIFPHDGDDHEDLLKGAEIAMYQAKKNGPDTFQFYRPEMNAHVHERMELENGLRKALDKDQLEFFYQPQFDLLTGKPIGVEALMRWRVPGSGLIPPGDFIPLAEETGLIVPIGEWGLTEACRQARLRCERGDKLSIAVNISGIQFRQPDFVDMVKGVLEDTGLPPKYLELEITESVLMEGVESTNKNLSDLKKCGIQLTIDDFGTGYSSLSYLKRFPIDKLKIDRSFIKEAHRNENDAAIVTSIIALAKTMRLEVVAEGIEVQEHVDFLVQQNCRQGQGFWYAKPMSAQELEQFLNLFNPAETCR